MAALALALGLAIALVALDAPRGWRLLLVAPLHGAALGLLQAREKT